MPTQISNYNEHVAQDQPYVPRAIEDGMFPFEDLSDIGELESWRKEISRPIYHIHKWWANRLGSVFRAVLLGTLAEQGADVLKLFYTSARFPGRVVFDPFMGSGTTVGEALKLGTVAIGRDINPVSYFMTLNAFGPHDREAILRTYREIERDVAPSIRQLYQARIPNNGLAEVLYYFWVKFVPCPQCQSAVDLFSSYIFAQHSYPTRHPQAQALCPHCGGISTISYNDRRVTCASCSKTFDPKDGPARGALARCPSCATSFRILDAVRRHGEPPSHRLYAKLVLLPNGSKEYLAADNYDVALYQQASESLKQRASPYPVVPIQPGYNTDQVLNYGYRYWHQMFNDRQLLSLTLLAERIRAIPDEGLRRVFTCLLSGALEFNNMFASYKGEGTGAVRHMFSHHILKPERAPLEANVWGTPKSSGSFSTLFKSRLLRALDYRDNPFELRVAHKGHSTTGTKVYRLSQPLGAVVADSYGALVHGSDLYLSCGDSAQTDIATGSVDAVVTDPPFFDNVHYSQLADFFYVWQRYVLDGDVHSGKDSTRSPQEVQQSDPAVFTERLTGVWIECYRVLRADGLLVFTYHHSKPEGWRCVVEALIAAGFAVVAAHPIKAEMSVAAPKHQAAEPINLDVILVCRKRQLCPQDCLIGNDPLIEATSDASAQVLRFAASGRELSRNDVRVVLMGQLLRRLSSLPSSEDAVSYLSINERAIEHAIDGLCNQRAPRSLLEDRSREKQLGLEL